MTRSFTIAAALLALSACASAGHAPDAQTTAWWRTTAALSNDAMEGRDTGSPGYDRAAAYVAERFQRAGLAPAGDGGTYFQRIAFKDIEVIGDGATISIQFQGAAARPLQFLQEISVQPSWGIHERVEGPLVFRGYCAPSDMTGVRGDVVICFGARRAGQTTAASRLEAATAAGAVGIINVDDIGFTIEPPRWPLAYARSVAFADAPQQAATIPVFRLSGPAFIDVANASGQNGPDILARG